MKINDIDLNDWKNSGINVDSLWLINERDKSGKHKNIYHGNFIPQIPYQLIKRFTKENELVFEPFMGSGTTLFECENLNRKYFGVDINPEMIKYVDQAMSESLTYKNYYISKCDSLNQNELQEKMQIALTKFNVKSLQFIIMHPPYMDIVKFTDDINDLSNISNIQEFIDQFKIVCNNSLQYLDNGRYFAIVIGDVYKNSEVLPLGFYCLDMIKKSFKVKLKGIIVKNIEGNRGKLGQEGIWKYRALKSDYFMELKYA